MTPGVAVERLSLSLGAFVLNRLDFTLAAGEILVVLGPNGSGKSVLLETVAGFHRPASGRVLIGGRDVTRLAPEHRNVAFVVQNFGLFPHLTVAQNVRIALRGRRARTAADDHGRSDGEAAGLLARFDVAHLAERTPQALSPGEKQRVALARALAAEPDLFLFDEPFSALDSQTRDQLREELLSFLRRTSLPAIFVTHDHTDAMMLADRIIVLRAGATMQAGPVDEVFHKPASLFVARFVGIENVLAGRTGPTRDGMVTVVVGGQALQAVSPGGAPGPDVTVCVRADAVTLRLPGDAPPAEPAVNRFVARVHAVRRLGALARVQLEGAFPLNACVPARQLREMALGPGRVIEAEIPAQSVHLIVA